MIDRMNGTNGQALMDVDRVLRDFYQAEMPSPWPELELPSVPMRRPAPRFGRYVARFALAASLALALFGYWYVAGQFPSDGSAPVKGPEIGKKLDHHAPVKHLVPMEQQRTPAGNDARVFEEDTPGGQVITIIGPASPKR